ncbi:MAG TPA: complex I NDUFA9 subunit family protein [Burkholderiaceae bacterium]|nr:complex I NDUFA9 subunit family protein [Burkholderiaceae bacterium]
MTRASRIVVLGGTGFVGRSVCEHLVRASGGAGGAIVVPTRRAHHGHAVRVLPTVEVRECDVHDDRSLTRAIAGADAVINLVAILHGDAADFDHVHVTLPRRLGAACAAVGVRRVVHVSALGVSETAPSMYLRSKAAGEAALRAAGLDLTIVRPSVIFGADDRFLNTFARLQALVPVIPLAGVDTRFQPVWVEDVAAAVARCVHDPATRGQTFEAAGPEVFTLAELVRLAGRWSGHERPIVPLPEPLARLQALVMECLPGEPLMSRDNLDSMQVPNVASGTLPGLEALGIRPTALAAVAPGVLGHSDGRTRLDALRALARRG